jgi:hypothetical protein
VYNDLIPGRWQSMLALPGTALSDRAAPGMLQAFTRFVLYSLFLLYVDYAGLARIVGRASLCGLSIAGNGLTVHTITAMLKAMPAGSMFHVIT